MHVSDTCLHCFLSFFLLPSPLFFVYLFKFQTSLCSIFNYKSYVIFNVEKLVNPLIKNNKFGLEKLVDKPQEKISLIHYSVITIVSILMYIHLSFFLFIRNHKICIYI
jgi:hypothetical protein